MALSIPSWAFEENGHNMVAQLMLPFLHSGVEAEFQRLYGDNWKRELVSFASSVQVELNRPKNSHLQVLQTTLFELGDEAFDAEKHCPNNQCSVAAVLESRQVLMRTNYTDIDKRQALIYLMHYMVQMHIPINCGLSRDSGGQKIYLKDSDLQPINFAWIWNYDLYRQLDVRWFSHAQELYREMKNHNTDDWIKERSPQQWAYESHKIAIEQVYPLAAEGRYNATLVNTGQDIIELQLMKAAFRTATMLNEMYSNPDQVLEVTE